MSSFKQTLQANLVGKWLPATSLIRKRFKSPTVKHEGRKLCIFAHFDRWNRVDPYVIHYLKALRETGCDIVVVSTCKSLPKDDRDLILQHCCELIVRVNIGYDFGSYHLGLVLMDEKITAQYDTIILVNDSVYGPLHPLQPIFESMEQKECDAWSMTDSFQEGYHLQSYFLVLRRAALKSTYVKKFWDNFRYHRDKKQTIRECEIGLSRAFRRSHLKIDAWCRYENVKRSAINTWQKCLVRNEEAPPHRNEPPEELNSWQNITNILGKDTVRALVSHLLVRPCNPTHSLWDFLVREHQFPFLKIELIHKNPLALPNLLWIDHLVPASSDFNLSWIEAHHKRVG